MNLRLNHNPPPLHWLAARCLWGMVLALHATPADPLPAGGVTQSDPPALRAAASPAPADRVKSQSGADERTPAKPQLHPRRRLLVNNDGTNLLWRNDLTPELVRNHVAECPAAVTTYLLCPNGIQKMMYPSAHEELSSRGALPDLVKRGQDPFGEFLAGLKSRGFETFVTFRMNEVHNVNDSKEPDLSKFWREHPEYRVARGENPNDWMSQCLDYSLAPVREYSLRLIVELLEKYQPDGIELDWMRFPRHLNGAQAEAWRQREHLTEVVAQVRAKANELAQKLGRPMLVAVRVPTSLAGCHALGADIADWNRRGLIDFLTAAPFLASDFSMPLTAMREALAEHPVPIYAGIEFGFGGDPHREETLRAAAAGLYDSGADGIYLFNFPCWRELKPHPFWSWIPPLGDPRLLKGQNLDFPMINGQHRVGGIDLPTQLPAQVPPGQTRTLTLRLPQLALAQDNQPQQATLTIEPAANLEVKVNEVALGADRTLSARALRVGDNVIVLANRGATNLSVTRLELRLKSPLLQPWAAPAIVPGQPVFYVSPSGADSNPGTETSPFRTLARASAAVRQTLESVTAGLPPGRSNLAGDITVFLRGGTYRLDQPWVLTPRDSGTAERRVHYRAYPGEAPVISGGRRVTGWLSETGGRWKAAFEETDLRQLYVNGRRALRARGACPAQVQRYGNLDFMDADAGHLFPDSTMATWRNPGDLELGYFNSWSHIVCKVESITGNLEGRAVVKMRQPGFFLASRKEGVQAKLPAYVENALELLDEPGEWYFDRPARTLYYLPRSGEDLATAEVVAPVLETLLRLEGTLDMPIRNVAFEGIAFAEATWLRPNRVGHADVQANFTIREDNLFTRDGFMVNLHNEYLKSPANVVLHAAEGCRFHRCTFTRLGGAGLDLEHGARDNIISDCEFTDISGSGIQLGDVLAADHHPTEPRLVVRDNLIGNNRLHDVGVEFEDSVGIFAGYTRGTVIAHNEIHHLPYTGVSVGWGWGEEDAGGGAYAQIPFRYATPTPAGANRVEFNHIHHVMLRRDDGGAIYTLGNQPGSVIRHNRLHDNGPGGPGGIYLDEGSGFIEITGNQVDKVAKPMFYNNHAQNRRATCFEHDNSFGIPPAP